MWQSVRAILWALASVVVLFLLMQINFVKELAGVAVELALLLGCFWFGHWIQKNDMKGFHVWARITVLVILGLGLTSILFFASESMVHRIFHATDE